MNYQILISALPSAKLTHLPKTTRRYNTRKDKKEKWMTNELLKHINKICIIIKISTLKHLKNINTIETKRS